MGDSLSEQSISTLVMAIIVYLLTWATKIPIKKAACAYEERTGKDKNRFNKFITLLPVVFGLLCAAVYRWIFFGISSVINQDTLQLGLTVGAAALSVYAFAEKFFARKKDSEPPQASVGYSAIEDSLAAIQKIQELSAISKKQTRDVSTECAHKSTECEHKKIILRGESK